MTNGDVFEFEHDGFRVVFHRKDLSLSMIPVQETGVGTLRNRHKECHVATPHFLVEKLSLEATCKCEPAHQGSTSEADQRPALDRLTLTISNVCNLGCSYCYAAGGTYYNTNGLVMTRQTALNALNQAARTYSHIEHINFFGGEPTLNGDIIEVVCEYARYLHAQGLLKNLPTFGITTNGYVLDDRMLEILKGYAFSVTLSLDGPKQIHDLKRPTKAGKGSYEAVAANAKRLLDHGLNVEFECTYTADHLRLGLTIVSLMSFFAEEFGCRTLHCPIVSAAPDSPEFIPFDTCLELQGDAIERSILNLARGIPSTVSIAVRILNSLIRQTPIWNYCPAGRSEVTINADGNIYACFMLMQNAAYSFGSVNKPATPAGGGHFTILGQSDGLGVRKGLIEGFIEDANKYTNDACTKCWAQPLCHGCLGEDFERHKKHVLRSEIPGVSAFCDYKRGLVERTLRAITSAYRVASQQPAGSSVVVTS